MKFDLSKYNQDIEFCSRETNFLSFQITQLQDNQITWKQCRISLLNKW